MIGLMVSFSRMVSMVLVLWGVDPILGNRYTNLRQNYVALPQAKEMSVSLFSRILILELCFRITIFSVYWWPNG